MMVRVVMSRETRTPCLSCGVSNCSVQGTPMHTFAAGRVGRYETTYRGPLEAFTMTVVSFIVHERL